MPRAQADRARLALFEDRDRIARDLHDSVVQRIFAVSLSLQGANRPAVPDKEREARIARAVTDLRDTSAEIRSTIHRLSTRPGEGDLEADLEQVAADAEQTLGFPARLTVEGTLALVPDEVARDLLAVVRESLTNVARHAGASSCEVLVRATATGVLAAVLDDGRGIAEPTRRSGIDNMAARARSHGGSFSASRQATGGTLVSWQVPLPGQLAG